MELVKNAVGMFWVCQMTDLWVISGQGCSLWYDIRTLDTEDTIHVHSRASHVL